MVALAASAGSGLPWWVAVPPTAVVIAPSNLWGDVAVVIASVWAAAIAISAVWNLYYDDVAVVMALLCVWRSCNEDVFKKQKQV